MSIINSKQNKNISKTHIGALNNESHPKGRKQNIRSCKKQRYRKSFPTTRASNIPVENYPSIEEIFIKRHVKSTQVKNMNESLSDWKALKKCDHQRLETVLEEEQLTPDEASVKSVENFRINNSEKSIKKSITNQEILIQKQQLDSESHNEGSDKKKPLETNGGNSGDFLLRMGSMETNHHHLMKNKTVKNLKKKSLGWRQIAFRRRKIKNHSLDRHNQPFHEKKWFQSSGPKNRSKDKIRLNYHLGKNEEYRKYSHFINSLFILKLFNEEEKKLQKYGFLPRNADSTVLEVPEHFQLRAEDSLLYKVLCSIFLAFILMIIKQWMPHEPLWIWRYIPSFFYRRKTYTPSFLEAFTKTMKKIFNNPYKRIVFN